MRIRLLAKLRRWRALRAERHSVRLTARAEALGADRRHDVLLLAERGLVRVSGTGRSITSIRGEVESLVRLPLLVVVRAGTCFLAVGRHQDMVTRRECAFTIHPCATHRLQLAAACVNAGRPIPEERARFRGAQRVGQDLAAFLEATDEAGPMVVQAGVWALTDGYTGRDVQERLRARDRHGNSREAVSDEDIAAARRCLERLGLRHSL